MGFLDNLRDTLSQGAERVKFETDKIQRTGRLRNEINDLQQQIATNFGQLGQRAYELNKQGTLDAPEVASIVQLIDELQGRLSATQQQLEQAQNEQYEAQQQQSAPPAPPLQQIPFDANAQDQPTAPTAVDAGPYACSQCGTQLSPDAAFCPNCGKNLNA